MAVGFMVGLTFIILWNYVIAPILAQRVQYFPLFL
ncbi:hypothetical protein F8B42_00900 [Klebsiella aerogenes]|nr:hypothetical protein F8B42_00900 [Klebsiella aerogenes]